MEHLEKLKNLEEIKKDSKSFEVQNKKKPYKKKPYKKKFKAPGT